MRKKFLQKNWVQTCVAFLGSLYIRFIYRTNKWEKVNFETPKTLLQKNQPFIVCFWHGRLLMVAKAWPSRKHPFHMLISAHKDGVIISKTVRHFGISTIPGSTRRGGTRALRSILRSLKHNKVVGFTPDGPRGPGQKASEGVVMASYLSGVPVVPVTFSTSRRYIFSTWDKFCLALPFGRGVLMWGNPTPAPKKKSDIPKTLSLVQKSLDDLNLKADSYFKKC